MPIRSSKNGFVPQYSTKNLGAALGGGGGGASAFTDLTDVPGSYSGGASKVVAVKGDESGLEFVLSGSGNPFPVYTNSGRDALTGLSAGYGIFNSDNARPEWWSGSRWVTAMGAGLTKPIYGSTLNGHSINTSLVARFVVNEGSGTTLHDISTSAQDMTITSGTWASGDTGPVITFDGISGYASGSDSALPSGSADRTIAMRLRMPNPTGMAGQEFFSYGTGITNEFCGMFMDSGHAGQVAVQNRGSGFYSSGPRIDDGVWHIVILRIVSSNWQLILDGVADSNLTITTSTVLGGTVTLGSASFPWEGELDSVGIWNRALSDDEIAAFVADPFLGVG